VQKIPTHSSDYIVLRFTYRKSKGWIESDPLNYNVPEEMKVAIVVQ